MHITHRVPPRSGGEYERHHFEDSESDGSEEIFAYHGNRMSDKAHHNVHFADQNTQFLNPTHHATLSLAHPEVAHNAYAYPTKKIERNHLVAPLKKLLP